jgi:hypothetical protein
MTMKPFTSNKKAKVEAIIKAAKGDISQVQSLRKNINFIQVFYRLNGECYEYPSHKPIVLNPKCAKLELNMEGLKAAGGLPIDKV